MKLLSLCIANYKNLTDKTLVNFDFSSCTNHVALIGLNGSGKSNILEAISEIFASLYHNKSTSIEYDISYSLNNDIVTIRNGTLNIESQKKRILKKDYFQYLPDNIIASYSGEELRLWENIYLDSYSDFFQDMKNQISFAPKLLYINKYVWEYALIALLSSDEPKVQSFIKNILKINDDVEIQFSINEDNYSFYENNEALSFIKRLVELQKDTVTKAIHINTIRTLDLRQVNNKDLTQKLFYYLYITGMPVKGEKIKADKIIRKTEIKFNGIDVKKLSEGEKKLILLYAITNILSNNKTLILLDEPDSHIHIERKKEIIKLIDSNNHFTLFTTHSPTILHNIRNENVRMVRDIKGKGVEVIHLEKMKALAEITNNEFSFIDATLAISSLKPLLLVEGKGDAEYINKAISVLLQTNELEIDILPFGGAANGKDFVDKIITCIPLNKTVIVLFDRDTAGLDGIKSCINFLGGREITKTFRKNNCIYLMLPKTSSHTELDFVIEDYFAREMKDELATKHISYANGAFNKFPKDLKQKIKDDLKNGISSYNAKELSGFKLLLDKLINIIQNIEVFSEVTETQ